jgi:uncharacterized membrane protein
METRFKFLGHPVHPMLIVFPLGLLSTAVVFDALYLITDNRDFAVFSFWAIAAGVVGGLAAALFGLIDWLAIPSGTRAKQAVSWLMRLDGVAFGPNLLPFVLGLAGALLALVTAWLGGELVYRLRVAVDDDAHLDASNSLSRSGVAEVIDAPRHQP